MTATEAFRARPKPLGHTYPALIPKRGPSGTLPLSSQPAFARYDPRACPVAAQAAGELLSLPLNPRLSKEDVTRVADTVNQFSERTR